MNELKHLSGKGTLLFFSAEIGSDKFFQWLDQYSYNTEKQVSLLKSQGFDSVIIINDISVDDDAKSKGIGKALLVEFISKNPNSKIVLVAEAFGTNAVNLEEWYSRYGFKTIERVNAGPLMIRD